jgi:hypothetical protein
MMGDGTRWLVTGERCGWSSGLWGSIVVVIDSEVETEKFVMHWKEVNETVVHEAQYDE